MPSLRQERLAEAYSDPSVKTHTQALMRAGYSKSVAEKQQKAIRERAGSLEALERAQARAGETARGIRVKALGIAARTLPSIDDPVTALQAAGIAASIEEKVGEDGAVRTSAADAQALGLTTLRAFAYGWRAARLGQDITRVIKALGLPLHIEERLFHNLSPAPVTDLNTGNKEDT